MTGVFPEEDLGKAGLRVCVNPAASGGSVSAAPEWYPGLRPPELPAGRPQSGWARM